ncbi:E3 ubiquitin-protein ligase RNF170-like isoform X2 [Hyla sarda]|nr:E3 ubiquitin-protein ligase RNF170-like isoform X2 [Hyla sarda]XP_056388911.1 E3 ubiquitin-protein ligase RNF170-like isoform X2 [Hyla sarda]XP_056388912.1 E3 ubiquitin-protein ligase RNF170-like isoform X2 [Hyla sarda]XP_056388913.1 E3 ubiquitin-protein ligase RNF170-like isoform X2 [Hyla sarda]XP_056388914.1 E3 ubiquitin-protein ligase RNF170-like isoform X2 [Hyla sarda]XP_056388915.1 E3 ubiquitin-protein ligase RNF170-like isoform X2 [Hyla sarda]XP_056388916.1 E3 ubiquitin-protein ligas
MIRPGACRCCTMDKPEIAPQRNDSGIFPPIHYKEMHKSRQTRFHNDLNCPVCLQTATSPVETNCGHLFCGPCLIEYWKHDPWLGIISCPLCRQKVHMLYDDLYEVQQQDKTSEAIAKDIRQYNNRFSGKPRPFSDYLCDLPSLLHLALRRVFTMGGLVWIFCLRIVVCSFGAIMCLSSPFAAAIPDPLCGILSAIDDLVVIFLLLICMLNISQQFRPDGMTMVQTAAQSVLSES